MVRPSIHECWEMYEDVSRRGTHDALRGRPSGMPAEKSIGAGTGGSARASPGRAIWTYVLQRELCLALDHGCMSVWGLQAATLSRCRAGTKRWAGRWWWKGKAKCRGPVSSRHVNTIHLGGPSSHTLITFTSISPIGRYTRHSNMRTRIAALAACALCAVQGVLATEVWGVDMDSMIEKVRAVSGGYTASPRLLARLTGASAKSG